MREALLAMKKKAEHPNHDSEELQVGSQQRILSPRSSNRSDPDVQDVNDEASYTSYVSAAPKSPYSCSLPDDQGRRSRRSEDEDTPRLRSVSAEDRICNESLSQRCRELEQRCEMLEDERDRMAELVANHQRTAEDLAQQLQELKKLHAAMGSILSIS